MTNLLQRLKKLPHFLYLFPFFFVFHGYVQNRNAVTATDFFELYAEYLGAAAVMFLLCLLLFRKRTKAALFTFALLFFHLFFGAFQYALKNVSPNFFLAKYSVLLPLSIGLFAVLFVFLRRTDKRFLRFTLYLNLALLLLIFIDVPALFKNGRGAQRLATLRLCDSCEKPDVFIIIADEYADSTSLAQAFKYNNGDFQASLRQRGFHVVNNSKANYNFTQYAVASLFKMDYLPGLERRNSSKKDINACYGAINENEVLTFFNGSGYSIKNFSVFNLANEPAKAEYKFVPMGKSLLSSQTFLQRLKRDLGYHLVTTFKIKSEIARYTYYTRQSNEMLLQLLREEVKRKTAQPRFVFTHVEMPHYPYYYDSAGRERSLAFLTGGNDTNKDAYIQYLQYANKVFLNLIDDILRQSSKPPVILFMGDHGFREFGNDDPANKKFYFMNLNAVYLPNKAYASFYDGLSGVNQFRALLNSSFGQKLPVLKDSSLLVVD